MRLHRTKCTGLLMNVITPELHKEIVNDILSSDSFYSLVIDESTDVSCAKCLCLVIRYFSVSKQIIVSTLYALICIEDGSAAAQLKAIEAQLKEDNLSIAKLIGIGVDGASVNVGSKNSLSALLRAKVPHLVTVRCVCHSLHLASSRASEALPRQLEFIAREVYNWFSHSTKRQLAFKELYAVLNGGDVTLKIGRAGDTRWLSRKECISKVVGQWDALKLHFEIARSHEKCHMADELFKLMSNPLNLAYMKFLCGELTEVCKLNVQFQAENANVTKLFVDLNDYYYSLLQKTVIPSKFVGVSRDAVLFFDVADQLMPASAKYLGYKTQAFLDTLNLPQESLDIFRERCRGFLVELSKQSQLRLPENIKVMNSVELLSVKNATSQVKSSVAGIASHFLPVVGSVDDAERQ
jgi:hypothetical protein